MQADTPHILVVDDDDRLSGLLKRFLAEAGFMVATACDAADARRHLQALEFDLIVLDRMMPGQSGLEFAADLRREGSIPILMLTAMGDAEDRIAGLEQGVDDYLAKPFEPRELLLRINAILRRAAKASPPAEVRMGDVTFFPARDELLRAGRPVHLTDVETALLKVLIERPGDIFSREELIE
ncbi:MAG: response regulator transcription factor, partial [Hyphomicrobium sp.]|nr:response regulator transcription factor [Hyphomicrobium sp.]